MGIQHLVKHRTKPHCPAAGIATGNGKAQHPVIAGFACGDVLGQAHSWPNTQRSTLF